MRPINAKTYAITDECRVTVGEQFLPEWIERGQGAPDIYCVPLIWARVVDLPAGHELEAWYVWNGREPTNDWRVSPRKVLDESVRSAKAAHLAAVVYEANLEASDRKYRLSCTGLFTSLKDLGHRRVWLTKEPPSFVMWTDFLYQAWHGKLVTE